ncbi:hypothetical protein CHISP_0046 [Chitinispirillum alkaliphilum]|nr:hypothetical protein CHISP_0046 [Chitinispirillum alkaliphilum]
MVVVTDVMSQIGSRLAVNLIQRGETVRGIDESRQHMAYLISEGVHAAMGDIADPAFLQSTLKDAHSLFLIYPLRSQMENFRKTFSDITHSVIKSVRDVPLRNIYLLSTMGADDEEEAGFLYAFKQVEEQLEILNLENLITFRGGYFMDHILAKIPLVKHRNMLADCIDGNAELYLSHPRDIAASMAQIHAGKSHFGRSKVELYSDKLTMRQVTKIIGDAIDEPELIYQTASDKEMREYYLQTGYSISMANCLIETAHGISRGAVSPSLIDPSTPNCSTKFTEFARKTFATLYRSSTCM